MLRVFALTMKTICLLAIVSLCAGSLHSADLGVSGFDSIGVIRWTNAFPAGVLTVETKGSLSEPWRAGTNYFTSNTVGSARLAMTPSNGFVRLLSVDISSG